MKNKLLILVILLMIFPVIVFADSGMPTLEQYDVVVTNKEGTYLFDYKDNKLVQKKKIDYNEKITIVYEEYFDDVLYGSTYIKNDWGYIKLNDTSLVNSEYEFKEENWFYSPGKVYAYKSGAKLYKGPSFKYDYIEDSPIIKEGSVLSYKYANDAWAYVNYGGKSGWIYIASQFEKDNLKYLYFISKLDKENTFFTIKDVKISKELFGEEYEDVVIPKYTEVKYDKYLSSNRYESYIYVSYEGVTGWVDTGRTGSNDYNATNFSLSNYPDLNALVKEEGKIILLSGGNVKIYKDLSFTDTVGIIKQYDEVPVYYAFDSIKPLVYYVDFNGVKGFAKFSTSDNISVIIDSKYIAVNQVNVYEKATDDSKLLGTLELNDKVLLRYYFKDTNWAYIESPTIKGWVTISNNFGYTTETELTFNDDTSIYKYNDFNSEKFKMYIKKNTKVKALYYYFKLVNDSYQDWYYIEYDGVYGWVSDKSIEENNEVEVSDEDKPTIDTSKKLTKKQIALIASLCGGALFVTSFVTIILLNRRKRRKTKEDFK